MRTPTRAQAIRPGKVLVLFVILLTALLGMLGLVIDAGLMTASHRRTQNAADSAALAAATELLRGSSVASAQAKAASFAQTYNGLSDATVTTNIPPQSGPHAGDPRFVEVVVTRPYSAMFVQLVGASPSQQVAARAVAGFEPVSSGEGAIVLDPGAQPGIRIAGGAQVKVKGSIVINSRASGLDQYGGTVTTDLTSSPAPALVVGNNTISPPSAAPILARAVEVVGGVDNPANIKNYDDPVNNPSPLYTRMTIGPDPLRTLPVPDASNAAGITDWTRKPTITVSSGDTITLNPGVYENITVNGGTLTLNSGVYIISPTKANQGITINGGTVDGTAGVMFYLTGSNYLDTSPGYWDKQDGAVDGPLPPSSGSYTLPAAPDPQFSQVKFATLTVTASTGSNVQLVGYPFNSANSSDKILIFQRRRNTTQSAIAGGGSAGSVFQINGTIYAKWARFSLSGGGSYDSQFIVGSLDLSGQSTMTINGTGVNRGRANQVFLVE
jgi:hypothetical protein